MAAALEPAIVTLATVYVMVWGYLQLTGRIEEPLVAGLQAAGDAGRRARCRAAPVALQQRDRRHLLQRRRSWPRPSSARGPGRHLDAIWQHGGRWPALWNNGGVFSGDFGYYVAGAVVWVLIGLLCVYTMFLIALSSIALAVLLALGPLFIVLLLFDSTRRFFEAWLAQLANYALITDPDGAGRGAAAADR